MQQTQRRHQRGQSKPLGTSRAKRIGPVGAGQHLEDGAAQIGLTDAGHRGIHRRERYRQPIGAAEHPVARMHHLKSEEATAHLTHGTQSAADRELCDLRPVEIQKAKTDATTAVIEFDLQHAPRSGHDLVAADLAGHLGGLAGCHIGDCDDAGLVFVTQGQMNQKIGLGAEAEPREFAEVGHRKRGIRPAP